MTILNEYIIDPIPAEVGLFFLAVAVFALLIGILTQMDWLFYACGICIGIGLFSLFYTYTDEPTKYVQALIDDTVPFKVVNEQYSFDHQSGDIYCFAVRDWSPDDEQ